MYRKVVQYFQDVEDASFSYFMYIIRNSPIKGFVRELKTVTHANSR